MLTVVTGATGHIGGNLVRMLLAEGRQVRCLVWEHDDNTAALDGLDVERVCGDVRDLDSLKRAFSGADVVYHLASRISIVGPEGGLVRAINVGGAANVAEACLQCGVRRLVHFSSIHARNINTDLDRPVDETRERSSGRGTPAYDISKGDGELEILKAVGRGLDAVIVCPTGVIGPLDWKKSRMGTVFLGLATGKLPGGVHGGFDWVDARDVAAGAIAAETRGRTGELYLLGGHYTTFKELASRFEKVSGRPAPKFMCPMWLARAVAPAALLVSRITGLPALFTPESLNALRANSDIRHDKAARELGFNPRPLDEFLKDIHDWFKEVGMI
ncbi:MAG TPA: SDR family oxidoreductase [Myxococcota bacterium]|nr:SDR family oxidoreductase [Myxococcota bacterium]HOH76388.1 SDR family oxidoreductase [Myxococcota bacterium]